MTTPALTALDLAPGPHAQTPDEGRQRRSASLKRLDLSRLENLLRRFPRHPGARPRTTPCYGLAQKEPTRSGPEDDWPDFAAALRPHRLGHQPFVGPYRVDVLFVPDLLVVELDGPTHDLTAA